MPRREVSRGLDVPERIGLQLQEEFELHGFASVQRWRISRVSCLRDRLPVCTRGDSSSRVQSLIDFRSRTAAAS
jgi:hypothetical protein